MIADPDAEAQIRTTLHRYCHEFDSGHFDLFARIFERGRWFMVPEPGPDPVHAWIEQNVILYDGTPLTRHEIANLLVDAGSGEDEARFRCYVDISQHLPGRPPSWLAQARFSGTFRRHPDGWWWHEHVMDIDWAGDLGPHIRGGLAAPG